MGKNTPKKLMVGELMVDGAKKLIVDSRPRAINHQLILYQLSSTTLFAGVLVLLLGTSGCVPRSTANAKAQAAFMAGQQQAQKAAEQAKATVYFRGDVKKQTVPWAEEMTLSKALLDAEYTGLWDPHTIAIIRNGETFKVNPKRLLGGLEDPLLEPGDTVEVHR